LDLSYPDVDRVAKMIPAGVTCIDEAMEQNPELKQLYRDDATVRKLLDYASKMEGLARHCSQHAAGVVITPGPLTDYVPVRKIGDGQIVTQYAMEPVEKLGLVKMDFLGLRTLSMVEETLDNIKENGKEAPDIYNLPLDDKKTYELLSSADTLGVFQLESAGMRQLLKRLAPDCFEDLIAALALYRPGPLGSGMVDQYVECKHGRQEASYLHPLLEEILKETHGVMLYQEQVMQCAATLGGYTLGQADLLRRAMGKKKVEVMERERAHFVEGCREKGIDRKKAEQIFDIIQEFAGYGFNKSHSTAYALISYQTAYLKAHFPVEFMAAFLSSHIHSKLDILARYVRAVKNSGIGVRPPDINKSGSLFTVDKDEILFGLSAVSKVGEGAVRAIIEARGKKPFESLWDFLNRVDLKVVTKSVVENLIRSGAFDSITPNRKQLLESLPPMIDIVQRRCADGRQQSLLSLVQEEDPGSPELVRTEDFDFHTRMTMEKEATGLYISGHPCEQYEELYRNIVTCSIGDLPLWRSSNCKPVVAGVVVDLQEKFTKKGDKMAILEIEDTDGKIEAVCFPKTWSNLEHVPEKGEVCIVTGTPQERDGLNLIVESVLPVDRAGEAAVPVVRLRIDGTGGRLNGCLKDVYRELKGYPGDAAVLIEYISDSYRAVLRARRLKVDPAKPFCDEIYRISGGAVEVE
jgi:DNA polymerase-3 subunit alpha